MGISLRNGESQAYANNNCAHDCSHPKACGNAEAHHSAAVCNISSFEHCTVCCYQNHALVWL